MHSFWKLPRVPLKINLQSDFYTSDFVWFEFRRQSWYSTAFPIYFRGAYPKPYTSSSKHYPLLLSSAPFKSFTQNCEEDWTFRFQHRKHWTSQTESIAFLGTSQILCGRKEQVYPWDHGARTQIFEIVPNFYEEFEARTKKFMKGMDLHKSFSW